MDYAIKKDRSSTPPKYLVFFKGRDADALTAAFTEYTNKKVRQAERQPLLQRFKIHARDQPNGNSQPGGRAMSNVSLKKRLIPWLPYILIGLFATNLGEAWRLASGTDASQKLLGLMASIPLAFATPLPSFHPLTCW